MSTSPSPNLTARSVGAGHAAASRLLAILLCVAGCKGASAPPLAPAATATSAAPAGLLTPRFDISAATRQHHFAYRARGDGFVGGHSQYLVQSRAGGAFSFSPRFRRGATGVTTTGSAATFVTLSAGVALSDAPVSSVGGDGALRIQRGPVTETLRNDERGVEQSWTYPTAPNGGSDLVVRVGMSGHRFVAATASGLHFVDPASGLGTRYSAASWIDARGQKTPIQPTWEGGTIVMTVPASLVAASEYPATLDPLVNSEQHVDDPPTGNVVNDFANTGGTPIANRIGWNGTNFVVVYPMENDYDPYNNTLVADIFVSRISPAGALLDTTGVQVSHDLVFNGTSRAPEIACDASTHNCLVVWRGGSLLTDISVPESNLLARVVDGTGAVLGGAVGPANDTVVSSNNTATEVSVATAGGRFVVAFHDNRTNPLSPGIRTHVYSASGSSVVGEQEVYPPAGAGTGDDGLRLDSDGTNCLAVWRDNSLTPNSVLRALRIDGSTGAATGAAFVVSDKNTAGVATEYPHDVPDLAWNGANYQVAWADGRAAFQSINSGITTFDAYSDIYEAVITPAGATQPEVNIATGFGTALMLGPVKVASNGTRSIIEYTSRQSSVSIFDNGPLQRLVDQSGATVTAQGGTGPIVEGPAHLVAGNAAASDFFVFPGTPAYGGLGGNPFFRGVRTSDGTYDAAFGGAFVNFNSFENEPATASDGTNWLVAWSSDQVDGDSVEPSIFVKRLTPGLGIPATPLEIGDRTPNFDPAVAYDSVSHAYLVVWTSGSSNGSPQAQKVLQNGTTVVWPIGDSQFVPSGGLTDSGGTPAVAFDGANFLVAWHTTSGPNNIINARFVNIASGSGLTAGTGAVPAGDLVIAGGTGNFTPQVAYGGGFYLVVWENLSAGDIYGARVNATTGATPDSPGGFVIANAAGLQRRPSVAFGSDGNFLVVWSDQRSGTFHDIYGTRVAAGGSAPLDGAGSGVALSPIGGTDKWNPRVVNDGQFHLVTWEADPSGKYSGTPGLISVGSLDVVGARVTNFGTPVVKDVTPFLIDPAATRQNLSIAADGAGTTLVSYAKYEIGSTSNTTRVVGNFVNDLANGATCSGGTPSMCAIGVCTAGVCSCPAATLDCDGHPYDVNGCETGFSTTNCGACAAACDTAHSTPTTCTGTTAATALCSYSGCAVGWSDCDTSGSNVNGCETNSITNTHCGSCAPCTAADVCHTGACNVVASAGVCNQANLSACATPYCALAGLGITPSPDPHFGACSSAGTGAWLDTDGDGISDSAETAGFIDLNCNNVFDSGTDISLTLDTTAPAPTVGAVDLFVHYDYVDAGVHNHNPPASAITLIRNAFAAHGVTLHIDPTHHPIPESTAKVVTLLAAGPSFVPDPACSGASAQSPHQLRAGFPDVELEKPVYHYLVFGHWSSCDSVGHCTACPVDPECGGGQPPQFGALGSAEIGGNDAIVSLGPYTDSSTAIPDETWAGLALHELGHNLGLFHGGPVCDNYKPNYLSMMNYAFNTSGIGVGSAPGASAALGCLADATCQTACATSAQCQNGATCVAGHCNDAHCSTATHLCYRVDYSNFQYNSLNEFASSPSVGGLDETVGLTGNATSKDVTYWSLDGFTPLYGPTNGAHIDWNQDTLYQTHVNQDLNIDGANTTLAPSNDWVKVGGVFTNLSFDFQCSSHFADAGTLVAVSQEPSFDDLKSRHLLYLPQQVTIDIRPGCGSNWIVLGSPLVVPVVLYGSAMVDVSQIDPATLRLAGGAPLGVTSADVNGDGFGDLSMSFTMSSLTQLTAGSTSARLTGAMFSSQAIFGTDVVTIVPYPGPVVTIHDDGSGYARTVAQQLDHSFQVYSLSDCVDAATDRCGGALNPNTAGNVLRILSDEADGGDHGKSWHGGSDMEILSNSSFGVRRERDASGDGRVYTIIFIETDSSGDVTQAQCKVQVPHDAGGPNAVDSGLAACIGTGC